MAAPTVARKQQTSVFPDDMHTGMFLKLWARDGNYFYLVEVKYSAGRDEIIVMSYYNLSECRLDLKNSVLHRGKNTPPFGVLRAEVATLDEAKQYAAQRLNELGAESAKLENLINHYGAFNKKLLELTN